MALTIKHTKVSTIPDGSDPSLVLPSDWNANHSLTGVADVTQGGTGAGDAPTALNNLLPTQTGNAGKVLGTNGTNPAWVDGGGGSSLTGVTNTTTTGLGVGASQTAGYGTFIGYQAGNVTTGAHNVFIGDTAGQFALDVNNSVAIGYEAMQAASSLNASWSTAVGYNALMSLETGGANTAIGANSGRALVSGGNNTFLGYQTGAVSVGSDNTFIGANVGDLATTLARSVAIGSQALGAAATIGAQGSVAVGYQALASLTTGQNNIGIGNGAGKDIVTGANNTIVGAYTGVAGMSGQVVLANGLGNVHFATNTSGAWSTDNINFGNSGDVLTSNGGSAKPTWSSTVAKATEATNIYGGLANTIPYQTAASTTAFVSQPTTAGHVLTWNGTNITWATAGGGGLSGATTSTKTLLGLNAGAGLTTGSAVTMVGANAGKLSDGLNAVIIGETAAQNSPNVGSSVIIGANAATATTNAIGGVTVIGDGACSQGLMTTGATGTVAVGGLALRNLTSGGYNVAMGYQAGQGTTTGQNNVMIGYQSGLVNTSGQANVMVGSFTGDGLNTSYNTLIGYSAGGSLSTGGSNTFIGNQAGSSVTTGQRNTIVGVYQGSAALDSNVIISDGLGNVRFQSNASKAVNFDGTNYGNAGQVLTSNGNGAAPTWNDVAGGQTSTVTWTYGGTPVNLFEIPIPAWANSAIISIQQLSNGQNNPGATVCFRVGGTVQTTGYVGGYGTSAADAAFSNALISINTSVAASLITGQHLLDNLGGGTSWMTQGQHFRSSDNIFMSQVCNATTASMPTSLVFQAGGAGTFDAGQVVVQFSSQNSAGVAVNNVQATTTKTANYTITNSDQVIFANANAAGFTITLPTAVGNAGRTFTVKRTDNNVANTLNVASLGGYIENATGATQGPEVSVIYISDGANWWELANG